MRFATGPTSIVNNAAPCGMLLAPVRKLSISCEYASSALSMAAAAGNGVTSIEFGVMVQTYECTGVSQ